MNQVPGDEKRIQFMVGKSEGKGHFRRNMFIEKDDVKVVFKHTVAGGGHI